MRESENIRTCPLFIIVLASSSVLQMVNGFDARSYVNVAIGKQANQSSTYIGDAKYGDNGGFHYSASLAVDGNEETDFHKDSCSSTDVGHNISWWEVDLQGLYYITRIKIFQRSDDNSVIARNVGAQILGKQNNDTYKLLTTININGEFVYDVESNNAFKGIKLQHSQSEPDIFLCLCEVEVFAVNVAKGKNASQSTTYSGSAAGETGSYNAELAVDGNTNTDFLKHSCSSTNNGQNEWWKVDFLGLYAISGIRIYQRKGVNEEWLSGYTLSGRRSNGSYAIIHTPAYNKGVINITVSPVEVFSAIMIELNGTNKGICLCEVQVFAAITCNMPELGHSMGTYTYTGCTDVSCYYYATLTIHCNTGYKLSGENSSQCLATGQWSKAIGACADIDECRNKTACDVNAQCLNTIGSHSCTCKNGFTGTGYMCTDIDECRNKTACDVNAQCLNTIGSHSCTCKNGFTGTGDICTDIDECRNKTACDVNAQCLNTIGSHSCTCMNGFTGTGDICTDIDECRNKTACDVNAQCLNTNGSHSCTCKNGFTGTGDICTDIDECSNKTECDVNAQCINTDGSHSCSCKNGFTGTGDVCKDIDECSNKSACDVNAQCQNTVGSYTCICKNGFTGTGDVCIDMDECNNETSCDVHAKCNNTIGSYSCSCKIGFTGNGTSCRVIRIKELPLPKFGVLLDKTGIAGNWTYNTTVTIDCNPGYSLIGDGRVECIGFGEWNGTLGYCSEAAKYLGHESSVASIAGGVSAAICVVIIGVIIAFIIYRRRATREDDTIVDTALNEIPCSLEVKAQADKGTLEKSIYAHPMKSKLATQDPETDESKHTYKNSRDSSTDYYSFTPHNVTDRHSIRVEDLSSFFLSRKRELNSYEEEYNKLPNGLIKSHKVALLQENRLKNRYKNIYPYDDTRVKLDIWDPSNENDYINACYINGFKTFHTYIAAQVRHPITLDKSKHPVDMHHFQHKRSKPSFQLYMSIVDYIVAYDRMIRDKLDADVVESAYPPLANWPGPTKGILNDFWRMVWQTKSSKIVMLTNLNEDGKHKCEQYWPDEGLMVFGNIFVKLVRCEPLADFIIRTLELRKKSETAEGGIHGTRQIKQFHFTSWPDRGVPRFASSLVHFRSKIHDTKTQPNNEGPIIVHCSAGIGRTGTFLALDYLLQQAQELGYINVVNCVKTLRQQRVSLVQTVEQYIFLHEALIEALTCSSMSPSTSEFHDFYRALLEKDNNTGKQRLDVEFEKIPMYVSDPAEDVYENAKNVENRDKNRYSNILPDKNHCPFLNVYIKGRDSYINAVFLPAYKENDIFIITQTPMENTIVDFWRLVYQFEVGSIVMLNTLSQMKEEERYWTEDEETLEILPFRITLESKLSDDICTNYTMLLNYHDERRRVRLSRATYWDDMKPVPNSPSAMLKQIALIQKWQQESGNKPIIVHCMNGAERSGLFCVVAALLERTNIEQDVAVEQIIKQMRSRRPQIIPNVNQFKFCYDAVFAYLDQFDTYSNFTGL